MKKIMSALMGLTLVVLFASTFYCSTKTQEVFSQQVERLNHNYPGVLQVELKDYQRGLLVSEVQTSLQFREHAALQLQHQIRHFPWGVRVVTRLLTGSSPATELASLVPLESLQLQSDIDLTGASETHFSLPELNITDSGQLQLQGLQFDCVLDGQLTAGEFSFNLDALQLVQPDAETVALSGVQLSSSFSEQQGLPLGNGSLSIEQLAITGENQPDLIFQQLHYASDLSEAEGQLAVALDLSLAKLDLAGEIFNDGSLQLLLAGIDSAVVREIQQSAKQLQAQWLSEQVDPLILQLQMFGIYSQLFKEGLSLTITQLALHSADGVLQGQGQLGLPKNDSVGTGFQAVNALQGEFQLDIDRSFFVAAYQLLDRLQHQGKTAVNKAALAEQAEQLAGGLLQKGIFIRRTDGGYHLEVLVEQGQGRLNGQPFQF